jgi:hypothetical protein
MGGDLLVVALFSLAFKFCNPAGMLPKFDVVTVNHSLRAFPGGGRDVNHFKKFAATRS